MIRNLIVAIPIFMLGCGSKQYKTIAAEYVIYDTCQPAAVILDNATEEEAVAALKAAYPDEDQSLRIRFYYFGEEK